jgi:hypothetical protein
MPDGCAGKAGTPAYNRHFCMALTQIQARLRDKRRTISRLALLKHDPENWQPVFREGHVQTKE